MIDFSGSERNRSRGAPPAIAAGDDGDRRQLDRSEGRGRQSHPAPLLLPDRRQPPQAGASRSSPSSSARGAPPIRARFRIPSPSLLPSNRFRRSSESENLTRVFFSLFLFNCRSSRMSWVRESVSLVQRMQVFLDNRASRGRFVELPIW